MHKEYSAALVALKNGCPDPFHYLTVVNALLSNPTSQELGRDLVIRALDVRHLFMAENRVLRAMVRKSGLYPYLQSEFDEISVDEQYAIAVYRDDNSPDFVYHSMQLKILNLLRMGHNVVLSAPTSMGKSAIVDSLIASEKYRRIVIIVPTIALIDETRRRISTKFSKTHDIISHNSQDSRPNKKTIYILTQERVNERTDIEAIDLFIIDEFYKLAFREDEADERTIALNICLSKLLLVSRQFYMIGPSIDDVRGLNTFSKSYVFIPSAFNTVAVDITEYNLAANDKAAKISALFSILNSHGEAQQPQTIIYCRSPKAAAEIASELVNNGYGTDLNGDYIAWLEKHYGKSWAYVRAIRSSIGIHHGALPRALQQRTIDLFNNKHLQVLICTSTIIEGVNTNAQTVIIFDNRNGTGSIDRFTHNNIKGRAGRMKKYFVGQVHCLEKIPEETFESKVVAIPLGLQGPQSPPNLLVGIDKQHLQDSAESTLKDYLNQTAIPAWLLRKFPSYRIEQLHTLLEKIETLSPYEFRQICARKPNASQIDLMCEALRIVEYRALQYCNLQSRDSDLKLKFSRYLFSLTHQAYVDSIVGWNESHYTTITDRSIAMDRDLKIIRNIFGFTVPRTLNLLQYLVNYVCLKRNLTLSCDYGYVISQFENCHLPSSVAALEEMGIPVQTLSKLNLNRLAQVKMQTIDRYLRKYFRTLPNFDSMDREFISSSLLQTIEVR